MSGIPLSSRLTPEENLRKQAMAAAVGMVVTRAVAVGVAAARVVAVAGAAVTMAVEAGVATARVMATMLTAMVMLRLIDIESTREPSGLHSLTIRRLNPFSWQLERGW